MDSNYNFEQVAAGRTVIIIFVEILSSDQRALCTEAIIILGIETTRFVCFA